MRHEAIMVTLFLWLAVQIPLGLLVASYMRAGSTGGPIRNAASRAKRTKIRRNHAVLAHGRL